MKASIKKEIAIISLFLGLAVVSFLYTNTLPSITPDDEYAVLIANKAASNIDYPQRDLLLNNYYHTYLYYPLIDLLTTNFKIQTYRSVLLFVYVFLTGYTAYLAFRSIKISRIIAVVVSAIALLPRLSIGSTFWGVFTNTENLGRSIAFPFMWLISAWHIRRIQDEKNLWPVFLLIGLTSYIHPVSMLFFFGLLLTVTLVYYFWNHRWIYGCKQFIQGLGVYILGAAPLLAEIFTRTKTISSGLVTASEYANALKFRLYWEFPPSNLIWLKAILVISLFFVVFILISKYIMRKRNWTNSPKDIIILKWSLLVSTIGVFYSIFLPSIQLFAIKYFNAPLLIQQTSRFFIFFYLGLFVAFAFMLDYLWKNEWAQKKWRWIILCIILFIGLGSSSIGSQWAQFLTGYDYSEEYYIPTVFHKEKVKVNDFIVYPKICDALREAGASTTTIILADDEKIRYFCNMPLYVTFKIGGSYLNAGKEDLVEWKNLYTKQRDVIEGDDIIAFTNFVKKAGTKSAVLDADSPIVKALSKKKMNVTIIDKKAIIIIN